MKNNAKDIELIEYMVKGEMPDFEHICEECHRIAGTIVNTNNKKIPKRPIKTIVVMLVIIFSLVIGAVTASAFGYNFLDLFWRVTNSPNPIAIYEKDNGGLIVVSMVDDRSYNSISEMMEAENVEFLYPTWLPEGYEFTHFEAWEPIVNIQDFIDFEGQYFDGKTFRMSGTEPYISFCVRFYVYETYDQDYNYTTNGIEYNIYELDDGLYKAHWGDGGVSYEININDREVLSKIIQNLKED